MDTEISSSRATIKEAEVQWRLTAGAVAPSEVVAFPDPSDPWLGRVASAAMLARAADDNALATLLDELLRVFDAALTAAPVPGPIPNSRVMYNAQALAATGLIYLVERLSRRDDKRRLLEAASRHGDAVLQACVSHPTAAKAAGSELLLSLFRIGIEACISWRPQRWDEDKGQALKRQKVVLDRRVDRLKSEIAWLFTSGAEPSWPDMPIPRRSRKRRGAFLTLSGKRATEAPEEVPAPDEIFYSSGAASWLSILNLIADAVPAKIDNFVDGQLDWLLLSNRKDEASSDSDSEGQWTRAIFDLMARRTRSWSPEEKERRVFAPLAAYSDYPLYQAAASFLIRSDVLYIGGGVGDTAYLADLRARIWSVLKSSAGWTHLSWRADEGMEIHLYGVVCAMFLRPEYGQGLISYARGLAPQQLLPFLPILCEMSRAAPKSPTVARILLEVLKAVPSQLGTPLLTSTVLAWERSGVTSDFWTSGNIAAELAGYIDPAEVNPAAALALTYLAEAWLSAGVVRAGRFLTDLQAQLGES